jgi:L-asparagine oxygenase
MNQLKEKSCPEAIEARTIRIDSASRTRIRGILDTLMGGSSFNVDACAEIMGDIGAAALGQGLTQNERRMIEDFGNGIGEPYMILDGLPRQENLPPTPNMFGDDSAVQFTDALTLAAIRLARLQPIAFSYENSGRLFRNVIPARNLKTNSSWGYKDPLHWHIDNAYEFEMSSASRKESPSPQFLFFGGLRNGDARGKPVPTEILKADDVVRHAGSSLIRTIQEPWFAVYPGPSNDRAPMDRPMPLLERSPETDEWLLRFNANGLTRGFNRRAQRAVKELSELLQTLEPMTIPIVVQPGTVFAFHNYRVLHRRKEFAVKDWPNARWLRRCFACRNRNSGQLLDEQHRPFVWK